VDAEAGVLHGVKILGTESKNGRVYPRETLERAAPLYEGARVNVNHPDRAARSYEDRIGAVRNVRAAEDGLYADFHFNPKHRLAEQLVWDALHAPENVGFSHNVLARTSRRGDKTVVEEITRVRSVDLVADPATTGGLFEGEAENRGSRGESQTSERLQLLEAENRRLRDELEQARRAIGRPQSIEQRDDLSAEPPLDPAAFAAAVRG
jgi:hypothetical protein